MSAPIIAFYNSETEGGQAFLIYHLAWMYADLGLRIVVADLDPRAHLTTKFLDEERLEYLWSGDRRRPSTISSCIQPLLEKTGDIIKPHLESVEEGREYIQLSLFSSSIALLVGDVSLARFEDQFSEAWSGCLNGDVHSFRVISSLWRILKMAASAYQADVILMGAGNYLGAIHRAASIAADYLSVVISPDIYSSIDLQIMGPILTKWRREWKERLDKNPVSNLSLPQGHIDPIGYIVLQRTIRADHPSLQVLNWLDHIPRYNRQYILGKPDSSSISIKDDPQRLALLKSYRNLLLLAEEARKPIFHLKSADGATRSHIQAAHSAYLDYEKLAREIAKRTHITLP